MMPPRHECAGVVQHFASDAEDSSVGIYGNLDIPILIALLGGAHEMLAAVLDPFHGAAKHHRGGRDHRLLGIEDRLGAEAAADIRRDVADGLGVAIELICEHPACDMRRLGTGPDGQDIGRGIVVGGDGAGLHRHAAAAMLKEVLLQDMRCTGECLVDVAVVHLEGGGEIAFEVGVRKRCAGFQRIA